MKAILKVIGCMLLSCAITSAQRSCQQQGDPTNQSSRYCTDNQTITTSGSTITIPNNGGLVSSFEVIPSGSPATLSIITSGCGSQNTCDAIDAYTAVASAIRAPTIAKVYDHYTVQASWTGGTSVSVHIVTEITSARLAPSAASPPGADLYGDSITAGFGDPSYTADGSPTQIGPYNGPAALTAARLTGYTQNFAHTGDQASDTEKLLFNSTSPFYGRARPKLVFIGTNNANLEATGSCAISAGCRSNYQYQIQAIIGWDAVPDGSKLYAQLCPGTGWASDTSTYTGISTVPMDSDTASTTATCPSVITGAVIQWAWIASTTVSGCATLYMDAVSLDTECSTGFSSQGVGTQNGLNTTTFLKTVTTTATPGSHVFTVTHDSSSGSTKYFEWAWLGFPDLGNKNPDGTPVRQPPLVMAGVPRQASDANSAITAAYDAIVSTAVAAAQGWGLNVVYCSTRTNITSSDATQWGSGSSNSALHPTRKGGAILASNFAACLNSLQ
jgi:hypothetical protein